MLQERYSEEEEKQMRNIYANLNEKERREYAALETLKLGHGGQKYICEILGCSAATVRAGKDELLHGSKTPENRIRRPGGGDKRITEKIPNIDEVFLEIVKGAPAGSALDETVNWTSLGPKAISKAFEERGYQISAYVVKQLLKKHRYITASKTKMRRNGQYLTSDFDSHRYPLHRETHSSVIANSGRQSGHSSNTPVRSPAFRQQRQAHTILSVVFERQQEIYAASSAAFKRQQELHQKMRRTFIDRGTEDNTRYGSIIMDRTS